MEIKMLYPTNEDAYEMLEEQHEHITGKWMYAGYDTFRRVYKRWLKRKTPTEVSAEVIWGDFSQII